LAGSTDKERVAKMQKKIMGVLITSLVANLIFLLAITGGAITINDKNAQLKTLALQNQSLTQKVTQYEANNKTETLVNTEKIKNNISEFVAAEFNYTNNNYMSRFEIIRKYVTDDVYNALKGPGDITTPKANFQNEVKNLDVYITTNDNKTIKALVNITTLYSMGGITNKPINQIYELELKEQEKEWIITKYTLMGNFSPYSTNQ
jgi:hypothetical protein